MEPQSMDKMDELILASLQELCVPPANNANFDNHSAGQAKRSYKKHGADATKKGVCQVAGCDHSLLTAYAKKYRVCNVHVKSAEVHIHDDIQRFCQKCSRFHPIAEFDGYRRTCRIRLAQHNTRRRLIRAMQRADREASPPQSSGEDYRARANYIPRAVPSYQQQQQQQQHPGMYQQVPRYQSQQQFAPAQLSARPASNGNGDMHSALLEVALAQLGGSDSPHGAGHGDHLNNGNDASQPAVYNPHASYSLPQSAPVSHPDVYRPSPLSQQHQMLQQLMPTGSADVASLLNNVDPQQLVQMLQLILSLQQMGCSLDQLEHPEVLPLMMSLLQAA